MEASWEGAVSGAVVLTASFGALLSILLEKWGFLKNLWAQVHTDAKPLTLLAALMLFSALPVFLNCIGAPEYILSAMPWVPDPMCSWDSLIFVGTMAVVSWVTSQAVFFGILERNKK